MVCHDLPHRRWPGFDSPVRQKVPRVFSCGKVVPALDLFFQCLCWSFLFKCVSSVHALDTRGTLFFFVMFISFNFKVIEKKSPESPHGFLNQFSSEVYDFYKGVRFVFRYLNAFETSRSVMDCSESINPVKRFLVEFVKVRHGLPEQSGWQYFCGWASLLTDTALQQEHDIISHIFYNQRPYLSLQVSLWN